MQKKLIALAIAGVAASTTAHAFDFTVGDANLSIYGVLDGSVYSLKSPAAPAGQSSTSWGIASNNMQTSRLGFGANTDIGSGWKITGNLEQEISISTGGQGDGSTVATPTAEGNGGGTYNRAANIGFASDSYGEIKLGRQMVPSLLTAIQLDALGSQSGGYANAWVYSQLVNGILITGTGALNGGLATNQSFNGGADAPNLFVAGLSYVSPVFNNIQVRFLQTFGSNNSPVSGNAGQSITDSGITDFSIRYDNGALSLNLADQAVKVGNGVAGTYTGSLENNLQLGGSYKFNNTKLTLSYADISFANGYKAALAGLANSSAPDDVQIWSLGGTQQVDKMKYGVSCTNIKDKDNSASGVTEWAGLADYTLNKQADIYAQVTSAKNKGASQYAGVYGAIIPTMGTNSGTVNAIVVGARYKF